MRCNIIKISRFCTDDGPGIRTTVFLKGCPLRCIWCHNPESQKTQPELWYDAKKCVGCKLCADACDFNCHSFENGKHRVHLENCALCGKCVEACRTNALEIIGKTVSADYVLNEIEKDVVFYKTTGGGVTISGGEPLFQSEFSSEILRLCKEKGIHTAIETSGFSNAQQLKQVLKYCDLVLFDIKESDEALHEKYTGVKLTTILENLTQINGMGIPFFIRMPIIPNLNDRESHFSFVKDLASRLTCCLGVEIMPYHSLGAYKYELLQRKYQCAEVTEPDRSTIAHWKSLI